MRIELIADLEELAAILTFLDGMMKVKEGDE